MENVNFSKNFVVLRKLRGYTQEQIAEKCGVSRQAITKWESGYSTPDIYKIVEIAKILDVSLEELVCGDDFSEDYDDDSNFQEDMYERMTEFMEKMDYVSKYIAVKESIEPEYMENDNELYKSYLDVLNVPDDNEDIDYMKTYLETYYNMRDDYMEHGFNSVTGRLKEMIMIERGLFPEILSNLYDVAYYLYENSYEIDNADNEYIKLISEVAELMPTWARILKHEIELEKIKPGRFI